MSEFRANDMSIKIQKKLLGKMAKKSLAKILIDDTSAQLLDNLHKLCKYNENNKKDSQKIVKYIIKIIIKISILARNHQFSEEEIKIGNKFKEQFRSTVKTVVSFHELDFSYDRKYITDSLNTCKQLLKNLVEKHLTEKSIDKIETVFNFYTKPQLLDQFFRQRDGELQQLRSDITRDLNVLLDKEVI